MSNNRRKSEENLDEIYCQSISKSISDVIRFSLDEPFRKRSFELFGVSCTADTKKEIYKKLVTLVENKSHKRKRDIEDEICTGVDPPNQLPSTSADNVTTCAGDVTKIHTKNVKKDWLLISSQQFRECIKRKRSCFCSQPPQQNRKDLFGCSSYSPRKI